MEMKSILSGCRAALIFILLININQVSGQDFKSDYKELLSNYLKHPRIYQEMSYVLYADSGSSRPLLTQKGIIKKNKGSLYSSYLGIEQIESEDYTVQVDRQRKFIFLTQKSGRYNRNERKGENLSDPRYVFNLIDSATLKFSEIRYLGKEGNIKTYKLKVPGKESKWITISFNARENILKKVTVYSGKHYATRSRQLLNGPRAEIHFDVTNLNPQFKSDEFAVSEYVDYTNHQFELKPAYKNFRLFFKKLEK